MSSRIMSVLLEIAYVCYVSNIKWIYAIGERKRKRNETDLNRNEWRYCWDLVIFPYKRKLKEIESEDGNIKWQRRHL